jgi:iron(III) transport system substrate-binding protein
MSLLRYLAVGLAITLLIAGCSLLMREQQPASDPNQLTVYTAYEVDEVDTYFSDFELAYPEIEVNLVRKATGILTNQLLTEQNDTQADVIWGVALTSVLLFEWNELLKPYAPVGLERVDTRYRDTRTPPFWVGNSTLITAFCVNSDEAARKGVFIPHAWADLIDPAYRRNIVMPNPVTSGIGFMAVAGILQLYGEEQGWRYLDELHKNIALYTVTGAEACGLVNAGEYPVAIANALAGLVNVEIIYPRERSGWELTASALVRKEPIQPAARTFLDWAISESAMRLYARRSAITAVRTGLSIPIGFPTDPEAQILDNDIPWAAANRNRILTEWQRRYSDKAPATPESSE